MTPSEYDFFAYLWQWIGWGWEKSIAYWGWNHHQSLLKDPVNRLFNRVYRVYIEYKREDNGQVEALADYEQSIMWPMTGTNSCSLIQSLRMSFLCKFASRASKRINVLFLHNIRKTEALADDMHCFS